MPVRAELLDELIAAGIAPLTPEGGTILLIDADGEGGWLTVPDADEQTARNVIAAHDPTVYEAQEEAVRHTYEDAIAYLKTIRATPNANITIDQAKNAIKALIDIAKVHHQQLRDQ